MGHSNSMRSILRSYLELRVYIRFAYLVFLYLLIVLLTVIEVVLNNWDKLGVPFTIVASVASIGRITYFTIIGVKNSKIKKDYLNSMFIKFIDQNLPNYNLKGVTIVGDLMIEKPFNSFEG